MTPAGSGQGRRQPVLRRPRFVAPVRGAPMRPRSSTSTLVQRPQVELAQALPWRHGKAHTADGPHRGGPG